MITKSIIISSSGLKNINLNKYTEDDDFILIFGNQECRMNRIFAEFISPVVAHLHQSDPTIQSVKFDELFSNKDNDFHKFSEEIITDETISILKQISSGFSVEINNTQAFKLRFLSIILGNEELCNKINDLFPPDFSTQTLNTYLDYAQSCYYFSKFSHDFDFSFLIDYLASNFCMIDEEKFLKLPNLIQYLIISNPKLQIQTEDSLFDIIYQIVNNETFSNKTEIAEKVDSISFLEQIQFTNLSEEKLRHFLNTFDFNLITKTLWIKFIECILTKFGKKHDQISSQNSKREKTKIMNNFKVNQETNPLKKFSFNRTLSSSHLPIEKFDHLPNPTIKTGVTNEDNAKIADDVTNTNNNSSITSKLETKCVLYRVTKFAGKADTFKIGVGIIKFPFDSQTKCHKIVIESDQGVLLDAIINNKSLNPSINQRAILIHVKSPFGNGYEGKFLLTTKNCTNCQNRFFSKYPEKLPFIFFCVS